VWTSDYGGNAAKNTFTFFCKNLKDYQATLNSNRWTPSTPAAQLMCMTQSAANTAHFGGGVNYLPYTPGTVVMSSRFDPKSIMLYASNTGGVQDLPGLPRANVYLYANGAAVPANVVPSQLDVQNLQTLYGIPNSPVGRCLAYMPCSPFQSLFNSVGCVRPL
jgi:hypothetical protein